MIAMAGKRLVGEKRLTFTQLASLIPSRPHAKTVENWARIGCTNRRSGKKVFLEFVSEGGRVFTSVEAYERFEDQMNEEN